MPCFHLPVPCLALSDALVTLRRPHAASTSGAARQAGNAQSLPASLRALRRNLYVTTIHVINTALVSLSCCTRRTTVYRGMSGAAMPRCFHEADETGLQGWRRTWLPEHHRRRNIAFDYAAGDGGLVLEIRQGDNDRGARLCLAVAIPTRVRRRARPKPTRVPRVYRACPSTAHRLPHPRRHPLARSPSHPRPASLVVGA